MSLLFLVFFVAICSTRALLPSTLLVQYSSVRSLFVADLLIRCRSGDHLNCFPGADEQLEVLGCSASAWEADAQLTADAAIDIDFTPGVSALDARWNDVQMNTVDRAHLDARFATCAIVTVNNRDSLGRLSTRSGLGHGSSTRGSGIYEGIASPRIRSSLV
jgi:hypothetical protein